MKIAFHEKAGRSQVDFDFAFLNFTFLLSGGFSERPGTVKGAVFCGKYALMKWVKIGAADGAQSVAHFHCGLSPQLEVFRYEVPLVGAVNSP